MIRLVSLPRIKIKESRNDGGLFLKTFIFVALES